MLKFIKPSDKAEKLVLTFFNKNCTEVSSIEEARDINEVGLKESKQNALTCWEEIKNDRYEKTAYAMTVEDHHYWDNVKKQIEKI